MEKRTQFSVWYFACALLGIVLLQNVWQSVRMTAPIPYSEFQQLLREGKVADIAVSDNQIIGSYKWAVGNKTRFVTTRVDPALLGGMKVKVGSRLFDASLKTKLDQMKFALKRA